MLIYLIISLKISFYLITIYSRQKSNTIFVRSINENNFYPMNTENRFVRRMQPEDIQEITAIYAHYVKETTVTFDLIPPSVTEMTITLKPIINSYPAWVCCSHNQIIGYAYAHPWKSKAAYATTLETTLYIHPNYTRQGLGQLLLSKLISDAQQKQIHALIACITYPNLPSEKLHEKFGFMKVSHFSEVGKKFGIWLDVADYELLLTPQSTMNI